MPNLHASKKAIDQHTERGIDVLSRILLEGLEPLKPGESTDYCGWASRHKPYYCIRPQHTKGRHRYGIAVEVDISARELPSKS